MLSHRPVGKVKDFISLNSQPLFGSCPGSLEGPWERAEKRLGVQARTLLDPKRNNQDRWKTILYRLRACTIVFHQCLDQ